MKLNRIIEEKRKQLEKAKKKETAKNVAVGTAIGTALGAAAGILLAPKPGKETREDISKKSKEVAENLRMTVDEQLDATMGQLEKVKSEVVGNWENIKNKKKDMAEDIRNEWEELNNKAEDVADEVNDGLASVGEIIVETSEDVVDELKK